jgi:tryptophan-rich sensory protein
MSALIIIGWYGLAFGLMIFGTLFTAWKSSRKYYKALILPTLSPPPYVFSIVWSILYTLIGTAGWLFQEHNNDDWDRALTWLVVFLVVSSFFSFFFFFVKENFISFMVMVASLGLAITADYYLFIGYLVSGYLFLPTVIWVAFATYLQLGILINNRQGSYTTDQVMVFEEEKPPCRLRAPPYNPPRNVNNDYPILNTGDMHSSGRGEMEFTL